MPRHYVPQGIELTLDPKSVHQLEQLYRRTKMVGNGRVVPGELRKRLRQAANPAQRAAKMAARSLPVTGDRTTGLRRAMARGITTRVRMTGDPAVTIRLPRKGLGNRSSLPGHANRHGWWRHPVYGDRDVWVRQVMPGWRDWFDRPMRSAAPGTRTALLNVIADLERRLRV